MQSAPERLLVRPIVGPGVLLATIAGSSMAFVDATVTNLALPALQRDLQATVIDAQWVIEAYALFLSALILVGGSLGDRLGRRRVFMAGVGLFTIASISCGLAQSVPWLIASRAVQGIGGALLTPGSLAIISATFCGAERGRAIGTWSGFGAIAGLIGPLLGGFLIQHASWRWVFFINVPIAAVVLAACVLWVPESRDEEAAGRIDLVGAGLATVGLGALVFGLLRAQTTGFGERIAAASLVVGVLALVAFVFAERVEPAPMVHLSLFRSRVFSGTNLLTLLLYAALAGLTFFIPLNLLEVQGYTPTAAGAAILPGILLLSVLSRFTGGLVDRYGARLLLAVGPSVTAVGFLLFAFAGIGRSYWISFFPATVVFGLGMAITVAPLTTAVMGAVPATHAGIASGINNAVARTAGLLAIAVLGVVFLQQFESSLDRRLAAPAVAPQTRQFVEAADERLAAEQLPASLGTAQAALAREALNEGFVDAFRTVALITMGLALGGALIGWFVIGPADRSG